MIRPTAQPLPVELQERGRIDHPAGDRGIPAGTQADHPGLVDRPEVLRRQDADGAAADEAEARVVIGMTLDDDKRLGPSVGEGDTYIHPLVSEKRVIVCCGAGGVGKTTTAAAMGLAGAKVGRRVLVLTIDPARRLAEAMGIPDASRAPSPVPRERLDLLGVPPQGDL